MRRLHPNAVAHVEPLEAYPRLSVEPGARPGVRINMIASLDGASSAGGLSGKLGGPADRAVFAALRTLADVVVVGAATMRAEGYGPVRLDGPSRTWRRSSGLPEVPPIAVVTRTCRLDWRAPFFTEAERRPVVLTVAAADRDERHRAGEVADVVIAGADHVEPSRALAALAEQGATDVLLEGGPTLNGHFMATGLVDELCLTLSPTVLAGDAARIVTGPALRPSPSFRLGHVLEEGGFLFLRLVRGAP